MMYSIYSVLQEREFKSQKSDVRIKNAIASYPESKLRLMRVNYMAQNSRGRDLVVIEVF